MDAFATYMVVFLMGALVGVIAMLAVDEYHDRMDEAEDYDY